jgi:hypothetical protein
MGKPTQQPYKDDPDAVSMHTTPDDYEYAEPSASTDDLPSYNDSEAAASSSTIPQHITSATAQAPPPEPYNVIANPTSPHVNYSKPTNTGAVTIRMDERLTDPVELERYISDYMRAMPPRPIVRIHGWHNETVRRKDKKEQERVTDFDITFSFQQYLSRPYDELFWEEHTVQDGEDAHRGSWRKTKAPGFKPGVVLSDEPTRTLKDWCEDFCASPSKLKVFRISRPVEGIDEACLIGQIENLIRSTHYRGNTNITFRVDEKAVDIYSPTLINHWRTSWIRWIFYLTFLWIITWPILFFTTKWWTVYEVKWSFARWPPRGGDRIFSGISEMEWINKHSALIRDLVLNKYSGDGDQHPTDLPPRQGSATPQPQMPKTSNTNVNSALSFIQGGVNAWNAVSAGRSTAEQGWGYDC